MSALAEAISEKFTPVMLNALLKGLGLRASFDHRFRDHIFQDLGDGRERWNTPRPTAT